MKKELLNQLYSNRLLRNTEELVKFEEYLSVASEIAKEDDIIELCSVFDDNTMDDEVMFGLIHLIETFSSERAFELTILGVSNMMKNAFNWAKIIMYRCLNDDFSRGMLKNAISFVDIQTRQIIVSMLHNIKEEDYDKFGTLVDEVLN